MKKLFGILCVAAITATALSFNGNEISDFETQNTVDVASSYVSWNGSKLDKQTGKQKVHIGRVAIKDAKVKMNGSTPEALAVTVDLKNIQNADLSGDLASQLITHLKSVDFFDVSVFPDATFSATKITKLTNQKFDFEIEGNIKIKGVSKPITVQGHIVSDKGKKLLETEAFYLNGEEFGFIKPNQDYNDVVLRLQLYVD